GVAGGGGGGAAEGGVRFCLHRGGRQELAPRRTGSGAVSRSPEAPVSLRLYSRPGCHLCEVMRDEVERVLADMPRKWDVIDVDSQPELAARYGESIPVLFVNGHLFAKVRLPRL